MTQWSDHLALLVIPTTAFLGPAMALVVMMQRKRLARSRRTSPLGIQLLRAPGQTLREQIAEAEVDALFDLMLLMVLPSTLLASFLMQMQIARAPMSTFVISFYALANLAVVGYALHRLLKRGARTDKLKAGYDAELAVGQELDQLMRKGAAVFHDVPAEGFNIDHVVVGRVGLFAIETKGFTKSVKLKGRKRYTVVFDGQLLRFPEWSTDEPLQQAQRQAKWLERWLAGAVGEAVPVLPVLALPGWFVERHGQGSVRVYSGRELAWLVDKPASTAPLAADQLRRIEHQLEQRCRNVTPTYKEDKRAL